jgi:hypothetical protein
LTEASAAAVSLAVLPTKPPTGTITVSPGLSSRQVCTPATIVVGFDGLAPMRAPIVTPYLRAMMAGLSPYLT